ncbi:hypothetical protein VTN31DRAFT_7059 [Thermomyces dupontii]|uniref:uncharacterized protein n=1 Tax=Talaromyces thermophilus TaxID=28565 RepID=UPI003742D4E1
MNVSNADSQQERRASPTPGPFGYAFWSPSDSPQDAGPAPPPGPSLLDDNESNMLDNFFTTLNSSQLDVSDSWFGGGTHDKGSGGFQLDWADELPPVFEGSTTSLSQPPVSYVGKDINGPATDPAPSSDILAAASMLCQNGFSMSNVESASSHQQFNENLLYSMPPPTTGASQLKRDGSSYPSPSRERLLQPQHTPVFSVEQSSPPDPNKTKRFRSLRWGSDIGFVDNGYVRPPNVPNEEEQTQSLLAKMECLEPQTSTTNTRAPTPERAAEDASHQDWMNANQPGSAGIPATTDDGVQQKKRSKSQVKTEPESDDTGTLPKAKRSRSSTSGRARRSPSDNSSRRGRNPDKPPRENLTEEQKRANHILSEQKRRNLIKQGFENLCSLVPELRNGGFSKSAILVQAAEWLEGILKGNEELRQQLAQLKAMNGYQIPQ